MNKMHLEESEKRGLEDWRIRRMLWEHLLEEQRRTFFLSYADLRDLEEINDSNYLIQER